MFDSAFGWVVIGNIRFNRQLAKTARNAEKRIDLCAELPTQLDTTALVDAPRRKATKQLPEDVMFVL